MKAYGQRKADIVLSIVQIMIAGNMYGIPDSAFQARLKGKPHKEGCLSYQLGMLAAGLFLFLLPIAEVHGLLRRLVGLSNRRPDKESALREEASDSR